MRPQLLRSGRGALRALGPSAAAPFLCVVLVWLAHRAASYAKRGSCAIIRVNPGADSVSAGAAVTAACMCVCRLFGVARRRDRPLETSVVVYSSAWSAARIASPRPRLVFVYQIGWGGPSTGPTSLFIVLVVRVGCCVRGGSVRCFVGRGELIIIISVLYCYFVRVPCIIQ